MNPRSESFFHLTKHRTTLESILTDGGFWPRYCFEQNIWRTYTARAHTHFWLPLVSFCDIPLTRLQLHAETYGYFGLGMTKDWGAKVKLHPVAYIDPQGPLSKPFNEARSSMSYETWIDATAFIKPVSGVQEREAGVSKPTDFYAEYEWRQLARSEHIEPRLTLPPHVADEDIPSVARTLLNSDFARSDPDGVLELLARITSLERIQKVSKLESWRGLLPARSGRSPGTTTAWPIRGHSLDVGGVAGLKLGRVRRGITEVVARALHVRIGELSAVESEGLSESWRPVGGARRAGGEVEVHVAAVLRDCGMRDRL